MSKFTSMWVFVIFDLPTKTNEQKKNYVKFRNTLLKLGFNMIQYSVYAKFSMTKAKADAKIKQLNECLPNRGEVRAFMVTDKQFSDMKIILNSKIKKPEKQPDQLMLF